MKNKGCMKKFFSKSTIGLSFMFSAALALILMPINAQALVRSSLVDTSLLANKDSITLEYGEHWCAESFDHQKIGFEYDSRVIACNSNCGAWNVWKNHYGLHNNPAAGCSGKVLGHAWAFTLEYHSDKDAYTVKTEMPALDGWAKDGISFTSCSHPWWNLAGKKTADGTRIQSYDGGAKKAENLFWVSYNTFTHNYRIWSALAGKPVGYTSNDYSNLKLVSQYDTSTTMQYFDLNKITAGDVR